MGKYLDFKEEGVKSVHFFMENLEYPIVIAVHTEQEEMLVKYIEMQDKDRNGYLGAFTLLFDMLCLFIYVGFTSLRCIIK